uniref:Uncharacterized protein n=2 Tax=Meloidogyne incognita group TaxID=654580 RepID=A0A914M5A3_MELIC
MPDWDHFFASLRKYLDYFRSHIQLIPTINGFVGDLQSISDGELSGLLSWTKLATAISLKDPDSRRQFCQDKGWSVIESSVGLLASPVPLVFKGCLCNFLAALAIDEMAAVNIWNCLLCEFICSKQIGGKSIGIQQDLDSREAHLKIYDYSQGFLTLMKELLSHKARPSTQQIAPFIHFIVNSILCQFSTRSYSNITQMWMLVKLALDCLYQPLKTFFVTAVTVDNKVFEVQILCQLLSDSPLSRALLQIIAEGGSQLHENKFFHLPAREDATCSAIRLLYVAISNRSALSDAIRAVNCDILIATIESILFSPFPYSQQKIDNCYMSLLFNYINEIDSFIRHAFFVWLIIKEATAQRPSLQSHIVQSLLPRRQKLINCVATLSIFSLEDIFVGINDLALIDIEGISYGRLKGEVCRLMLEVFNDAMQYNSNSPNITYALMNFDLMNISATILDLPGQGSTCLHNILDIVLQLKTSDSPLSTHFSGLYEPALRLILRLCSLGSSSSSIVLRFLRSHYDLIYQLALSKVFKCLTQNNSNDVTPTESFENESSCWRRENDEYALATIQRSLQSIILELIALDLSSLLRSGLIEHPHKYLRLLFSTPSDQTSQSLQSSNLFSSNIEGQNVLFWSLLESSRIFVGDLSPPICNKFDPNKMEELLSLCIRKNSCNIEQFDVVYLQLLLNSEINCIMNTEIDVIREEARSILHFCVKKNALNLLEGSCTHLLEGWLSVMNVLSVHVPLPFINISTHKHILVDALFLLRDYCRLVEMSSELAASVATCFSRIVSSVCSMFEKYEDIQKAKSAILPVLHLLIQCIVLSGYSKSFTFKRELYICCLRVLDLFCNFKGEKTQRSEISSGTTNLPLKNDDLLTLLLFNKLGQEENKAIDNTNDQTVKMMQNQRIISDLWMKLIEPLKCEIIQTFTSDVIFGPLSLKMLAAATFVDLLREDSKFCGRIIKEFIFDGSLQCVNDLSKRFEDNLKNPVKGIVEDENNRRRMQSLINAIHSLNIISESVRNRKQCYSVML